MINDRRPRTTAAETSRRISAFRAGLARLNVIATAHNVNPHPPPRPTYTQGQSIPLSGVHALCAVRVKSHAHGKRAGGAGRNVGRGQTGKVLFGLTCSLDTTRASMVCRFSPVINTRSIRVQHLTGHVWSIENTVRH